MVIWTLECFTIFSNKAKLSQQFWMCFRTLNPKFQKNWTKTENASAVPCLAGELGCVRLLQFVFSLAQPQFWFDFSEILDLRSWNTFKTAGSVWLCLKKWWNTLTYVHQHTGKFSHDFRSMSSCHCLQNKNWV